MMETVSVVLGGQELTLETGRLAKQADGAVLVRFGDSEVLVTACARKEQSENRSFLPLTCDYREYTYAAGKIPGGFFKREGRPTEKEVLTSRMIDRPIRPLFPEGYFCEIQVIAMVLSADPEVNPDVLGMVGSSAALFASDIPFHTPIAAVRVGLVDGEFVCNPTHTQCESSALNLLISASEEGILMVEAGAQEIDEARMVEALEYGHGECRKIIGAIRELATRLNPIKREVAKRELPAEIEADIQNRFSQRIRESLNLAETTGKHAYEEAISACKEESLKDYQADEERQNAAALIFNRTKERLFREQLLQNRRRPDGRSFDQVRQISCEVSFLPRAHGSGLFTRGETQALVTTTLGAADDAQMVDGLTGDSKKSFMLHYNFPPFSVGEVRFLRGPGRREIGHGALAERAIAPVLPSDDEFPYTLRVVSDILESNGSSSMASVCGGILALQDAGVPIKKPVAGIAMGLVKEGDNYAILSDIAGAEDHYGDMDFKVAGTRDGITALQMDIKIGGVTREIMAEALQQANAGRNHILDKMAETLSESRPDISEYAPRIITLQIPVDKIGAVIGPGGKMIRGIVEETGVKIDIEDDGKVKIFSSDGAAAAQAVKRVEEITAVPEVDKTYLGTVTKVVDFGAFVEIIPNNEGLLHISELSDRRVEDIYDEVKLGDQILVKVLSVDQQGKVRLSRRAVLAEQRGEKYEAPPPPNRGGRPGGGRRDRNPRFDRRPPRRNS